jgi:hypothetical protein
MTMTEPNTLPAAAAPADRSTALEAIREKLIDAMTPGYQVEFDPIEADRAGAFEEDALSEADALESALDLWDASAAAGARED